MWQFAVLCAAVSVASAQDVRVYSELTRVDPYGNVVKADRGGEPREILSPGVPRNGYSTFRVVISGEPGMEFTLHTGQNPENAVGLTMYREIYVRSGQEWIPDGLEKVQLPFQGRIPTADIPGQVAQSFLMDLHVDRSAPVRRIKVEPQVWMVKRWVTYPMEVRVVAAVVPDGSGCVSCAAPPADVGASTDKTVWTAYQSRVCGLKSGRAETTNSRMLLLRNAFQDIRLAGQPDRATWCAPFATHDAGPEWYLRVRDQLLR